MLNQWRTEGQLARLAIGGAVAVFLVLIVVVGPFFRSFDEAKYLGIGYSMLAGNGPRTVFGTLFLPHSPLWPTILAAPDVWFHVDPFAWGQFLNAIAGATVLLLVGWFGWQFRPVVGALAVAAYLALPYLQDLTRTARLDVPAAALVLAYLVVGIEAVRRDSVRWALLAGAIFAAAFLVKEIVLPVAPVPFLVGLLIGRPLAILARVAAAIMLVAVVGSAWWFVEFAGYTHQIYRVGAPARWLGPLYFAAAVGVVLGLAAPRLAARPRVRQLATRMEARLPAGRGRQIRIGATWGLALLWFVAFVVFFARNPELKGVGLVSPSQYGLYLQAWLPTVVLRLLAAVLALGVLLGFVARRRMNARPAAWFDALVLALLCSLPLVMLVIAVGEPPRNYLAQIGIVVVVSSVGWLHALGWLLARRGARVDATAGDTAATSGRWTASLGVVVVAMVTIASVMLAAHALGNRESATTSARAVAVARASSWIEANVPAGTRIGFGSFLGYETAVDLAGRYPMVQIHQSLAVVDPSAPLGLAQFGASPIDDWIAIDVSRREREFYAFRASTFGAAVIKTKIAYYVYLSGPNTSVPALLGALTTEHGFRLVHEDTFGSTSAAGVHSTTALDVFAVDPGRVDLTASPLFATPIALDRLVGLLVDDAATLPTTAADLAARAKTWPDPAAAAPILARLRALAA